MGGTYTVWQAKLGKVLENILVLLTLCELVLKSLKRYHRLGLMQWTYITYKVYLTLTHMNDPDTFGSCQEN